MTIAIMQPYFLPYIGYWQLINAVDTFVILDDVNFIKKGYINRNSILINNQANLFTLELLTQSQNKLINKINIGKNRKKLLKTIENTYRKAPFFDKVFYIFEDIFLNEEENLAEFLGYSLKKISNYLGLDTKFKYSSKIKKNNNLKSEDKILNICKIVGAKKYINTIGGKELYYMNQFKKENIELLFIEPKKIEYQQFNDKFISNLSIVDIMMFNNIDSIKSLINDFILINGGE